MGSGLERVVGSSEQPRMRRRKTGNILRLTTLPQSMPPLTLLTPQIRDPWLRLTLKQLSRRQQLPSSPLPPTPGLRPSRLTLPSGRP